MVTLCALGVNGHTICALGVNGHTLCVLGVNGHTICALGVNGHTLCVLGVNGHTLSVQLTVLCIMPTRGYSLQLHQHLLGDGGNTVFCDNVIDHAHTQHPGWSYLHLKHTKINPA